LQHKMPKPQRQSNYGYRWQWVQGEWRKIHDYYKICCPWKRHTAWRICRIATS